MGPGFDDGVFIISELGWCSIGIPFDVAGDKLARGQYLPPRASGPMQSTYMGRDEKT